MTTREELAAALYGTVRSGSNRVSWTELGSRSQKYWLDIADALLASPALARVIREAKAEVWEQGANAAGPWVYVDNPYRDQTEEH